MDNFLKISVILISGLICFFPTNRNMVKSAVFPSQPLYCTGSTWKIATETSDKNVQELNNEQQDPQEQHKIAASKMYIVENKIFYSGNKQKKQVALTFDDGPSKYYTDKVLDILKEYNVKATFFLIGSNVQKYPEVVKRIAEEGHQIGNHSWAHRNFKKLTNDEMRQELDMTEQVIDSAGGKMTNLFRPPYGSNPDDLKVINAYGYNVVNWSVDTKDWSGISQPRIMSNVESRLGPGSIILMHSSGRRIAMENMLATLPRIIVLAREKGYEFATVSEVLELQCKEE
jgi:polysaccharide deacetylase family sporulation protein PdaB